jgi:hypothetical protein
VRIPKRPPKEANDRVIIRPMLYNTFIKRAEKRMLGLRDKLRDAPFLRENGLDAGEFLVSKQPFQDELDLAPKQAAVQ